MAEEFYTKDEVLVTIKEMYDYLDHKLVLLSKSFESGQFAFLKDNIDIVNSRADELERQLRTMNETSFGAAEILGFFLAPLVGNLLIQPVFNKVFDMMFRRISVNKIMSQKLSNLSDSSSLKTYREKVREMLTEQFDLSGPQGTSKFSYLYGAVTKETVGGMINDSSQNIVSFVKGYSEKKDEIAKQRVTRRRSHVIAALIAVTQTDIYTMQKKAKEAYDNNVKFVEKEFADIQYTHAETELGYFVTTLKQENAEIAKEKLSDTEFSTAIIVHTNNFLFLSFLGDTDIGIMVDTDDDYIPADSTGGTGAFNPGHTGFVPSSNINKPLLDYLLRNFPDEENSFILNEVHNPMFPLFKPKGKTFANEAELIKYWVDFYINNPTEGKIKYKGLSRNVSTYDRAADKLNEYIKKVRPEMGIVSTAVITNLESLSRKFTKP